MTFLYNSKCKKLKVVIKEIKVEMFLQKLGYGINFRQ